MFEDHSCFKRLLFRGSLIHFHIMETSNATACIAFCPTDTQLHSALTLQQMLLALLFVPEELGQIPTNNQMTGCPAGKKKRAGSDVT